MILKLLYAIVVASIFSPLLSSATTNLNPALSDVVLENQFLKVAVNQQSGCFTVTEKQTGQVWNPDPWENSAGLLTLINVDKKEQTVNISKSQRVEVSLKDKNSLSVNFINPFFDDGSVATGVTITSELRLAQNSAQLDVEVIKCVAGKFRLISLRYPSRQFSL